MNTKPRTFGRTELAQAYFPQLCPEAAWHKLRQWITLNPALRPISPAEFPKTTCY